MFEPKRTSALDTANRLLAGHAPRLLSAFAALYPKRPPQSMRALQPLAFVILLEAFGLAVLLTDEQRAAAWAAARGPGAPRSGDDYDPTDDSDDAKALRWVAARHAACDEAYRAHARADYDTRIKRKTVPHYIHDFRDYMKSAMAPSRVDFETQWGERNPIDPATVPACFDPRAQLSILDAISPDRDGALGLFMTESRLHAEAPPVLEYMGHRLDLTSCSTLTEAAWRAITERWIVYLDFRGATSGLRLLPPTDGIRIRLRAPLVNLLAADAKPALSIEAPTASPVLREGDIITTTVDGATITPIEQPKPPCDPVCFYHQAVGALDPDDFGCTRTIGGFIYLFKFHCEPHSGPELEQFPLNAVRDASAQWLARRVQGLASAANEPSLLQHHAEYALEIEHIRTALISAGRDPDTGLVLPTPAIRFTCDCPTDGCTGPGDAKHEPHPEELIPPPARTASLSDELPDPNPSFPPSTFFDDKHDEPEDSATPEEELSALPARTTKAKVKKRKASGAESKIRKGGKRART
jgi:hypothetical protein